MELFIQPVGEHIFTGFVFYGPISLTVFCIMIDFPVGFPEAGAALTKLKFTERANLFNTRTVHVKGHFHINHI